MAVILVAVATIALTGTIALLRHAPRLRAEIDDLLDAFAQTQHAVQPLVATVSADRDRLARRLAQLRESGTDPAQR